MEMIGHDCVSAYIDCENRGKDFYAIQNPLLAMIEVLIGGPVIATKECSAHAARNTVVIRGGPGTRRYRG